MTSASSSSSAEQPCVRYERHADAIGVVTFDSPGESVNSMHRRFATDLAAVVAQIEAERDQLTGVVLVSAKTSFIVGADLREMLRVQRHDAADFFAHVESTKALLRRLEKLGRPVVAAINGSALGGGLEVALACHHRVCVDDARIQIGFPEVSLGLLAGAGGVTKTIRLMGLQAGLPLLTESKRLTPQQALKVGYINALVANTGELLPHAKRWIAANPNPRQPWDDPQHRIPGGTPSHPALAGMLPIAPAMLLGQTRGNYPAPEATLSAAVEGAQVDFDTALRIESRYLTQLATGQVAKNMINTFFFQLNEVKAGKSRPAGPAKWRAGKVGIVGAGMMGAGIAWACANRGVPCVLLDLDRAKAEQGKTYSAKLLAKRVESNRIDAARADATLALIEPTERIDALTGCDLVIEAVFEDRALKARITQQVEAVIDAGTVIASNTSTLPITNLAQASRRPAQFIGLHFFSPVDKMQLVEIIRGANTDDATLAKAYDFVLQIGKTPIVVNDKRAFYTSRVFGTFVNEGMALLGEGMPAAMVEHAGEAIGMPVGPLAVLDEVSLKLADDVLHQELADLEREARGDGHHDHGHADHHDHGHDHDHDHDHGHDHDHNHGHDHDHNKHHDHGHGHGHGHGHEHDHVHDPVPEGVSTRRTQPHSHGVKSKRMPDSAVYVLEKMAHGFKRLGRAHGAGFYDYPSEPGAQKSLWSGLKAFERGRLKVSFEDARDRLLYIQAIETMRCLEEGVLGSTRDANIGSIFGWGFPGWTGGTAQFINHIGVKAFVERADQLAARFGERFTVPKLLREHAARNEAV